MFKRNSILFASLVVFALASCAALSDGWRVRAQDGAGPEPGVARTDALELVVKAGFGRLEVNNYTGTWVPFRVTIANQGEPVTGRLVVRTESSSNPNAQVREFIKEIQLPTGSRQFHEVAAFLNSGQKDPEIKIVSDGVEVIKTTVKVERNYGMSDQLEIAVVDTDPTTLNNITSTEITRSPSREPFKPGPLQPATQTQNNPQAAAQPNAPQANAPQAPGQPPRRSSRGRWQGPQTLSAHPVVISAEDLPRDFVCYDPLDVVVIGDAPLGQLTETQARALKLWVASGGTLIVTGAADIAGMRATGLDQILPVEAQGAITAPDLPDLNGVYGRFETADPLLIMSSRPRQGARTLLGAAGGPIVAEKNYGSGLVRFVAFNPKLNPYRGWGSAKYLWTDLLLTAAEAKPRQTNWITVGRRGNSSSSRWGIQNFLFRLAEIEPPSSKYFLLFLLSYILLVGPINYVVLRWMGKLDLAWLTIPAVVILFTSVSVAVAQISRGGASIAADVALVEMHQRENIARESGALLIMPTSKGTQQISFSGHETFANDTADTFSSGTAWADTIEVERKPEQLNLSVPMNTWTAGIFRLRSITDDQPPLASAAEEAGATVTIKNLADVPIIKAVYLSPSGISAAFDIAAGEQQRISLGAPQGSTFNTWYLAQLTPDSNEAQVFEDLAGVLDREIGGESAFTRGFFDTALMPDALKLLERPLLIGFAEKSLTPMSFRGSIKRRSKAFYVIHL